MAKQHPVTPPELFASIVANHFVKTYENIHSATVEVINHRWTRIHVNGEPHPHSFLRDGQETRNARAIVVKSRGISIRSAIAKLHVLKSTGSAFHGFIRDDYTTLPEVFDRILSTEVDCGWTWATFSDQTQVESSVMDFDAAWNAVRTITMNTFAVENSTSVQNTIYKLCEQVLDAVPGVETVDYSLPNKHYFEVGMLGEI
jgi:urate oxidase